MRTFTPTQYPAPGRRIVRVKRACNGCGQLVGDVTEQEINAGMDGLPLPDVRGECDWCATQAGLASVLAEQAEFDADLAYLQGLSSAIVEHVLHATGPLYYSWGISIAEKMLDEISLTNLRDIANVMSPNERIALLRSVS
ncbi:hypothetical protein MM1218R_01473 [Mycobacterium marinum]|uniref:hypothetical protein n=1 Tax=Mycobacterium marinum TaxID=1781 RepID=UPI000E28C3E7|nr:hypothetical protein [Mycobacterium marinum]AXN43421.1 hypothetical protein MM1218R_01473 [Mycobacterium marinum]RFZ11526.1 hypothetical protein DE4381_01114 [Mycobacterium marinum]